MLTRTGDSGSYSTLSGGFEASEKNGFSIGFVSSSSGFVSSDSNGSVKIGWNSTSIRLGSFGPIDSEATCEAVDELISTFSLAEGVWKKSKYRYHSKTGYPKFGFI